MISKNAFTFSFRVSCPLDYERCSREVVGFENVSYVKDRKGYKVSNTFVT